MKKSFNEDIAKFFEIPSRESFRDLLQNHFGEQNYLDFKQNWPNYSKLAKHILAMANSGGGIIVVGVSEKEGTLDAVGLKDIIDKSDINKGCTKFLADNLKYEILDFAYDSS